MSTHRICKHFFFYFFTAFLIFTSAPGYTVTDDSAGESTTDIYSDLEVFANTLSIIDKHYVDRVQMKSLIMGALKGMLSSLDPHSQFLDSEAHQDIKVETEGKFGGIGVEISIRDGVLTVVSPIDDTPAGRADILPNDKIVKIDETSTRGLELDDAVKLLRGKIGSEVALSILREGESRLINIKLTRAVIKIESVRYGLFKEENIGLIRISEFQENTPSDFRKALRALEQNNLSGLIFDLRNNPGGLLPEAVKVAEEFIPDSKLIVLTQNRNEAETTRYHSSGIKEPKEYPIVILINGGTASASEIIAGAMQDYKLAILLGVKSFGKGSVQTVIPMRGDTAIRLTTSRYLTPAGRLIHGIGLTPDIAIEYKRPDENPDNEKNPDKEDPGMLPDLFSSRSNDEWVQKLKSEDNQMQRALDLLRAFDAYNVSNHYRKDIGV